MIRKLIAIIVAVLINVAVLACFYAWGSDAVASATPAPSTHASRVLPTVTVRPTQAQIEMLHGEAKPANQLPHGQGQGNT